MILKELLSTIEVEKVDGSVEVQVEGIAFDSRKVRKRDIFVCLPGTKTDGREFIDEAVIKGAIAIVIPKDFDIPFFNVTTITVLDPRIFLSKVSAEYYKHPSKSLRMIGVTGTNGKTTTTHLIDKLMQVKSKKETGLIGTISYKVGAQDYPVEATTPEASTLHEAFNKMVEKKINYCTMEVSSHSLDWHRVDDCDFNIAVLTNITEDHLDFHKTFDSYLRAKTKLFSTLLKKEGNYAVVNNDDKSASHIIGATKSEVITYAVKNNADIRSKNIKVTPTGASFIVETPWGSFPLAMKMTGLFSVYNALAAITVGLKEGLEFKDIKKVLEEVVGIPGRFEKVDIGQDFGVIVDYAHTPDGLENILSTVREFCPRDLITVFGCGGDRDRTKRSPMGKIALKYSDFAIITNDNPRTESPAQILEDVLKGIDKDKDKDRFEICLDREEAIKSAINRAKQGDVVVIAGKGHETYQIFADKTIDFDDREIARPFIKEKMEKGS